MKQIIKAEAKNLGFSLFGITSPDAPDHYSNFEAWLADGCQADMGYLARTDTLSKRRDPRLLMPECRSILCLAYPTPNANTIQAGSTGLKGRMAAYAWGQDYHIEIPARVDELIPRVEKILGRKIAYRAFTDSAPILERDLAQRAGLGWIGKNGCLINPDLGSFFLLAEVFMDIELDVDQPFTADRCGSCHRCIEACPTRCIQSDRTIDSRRCISYLTIEHKGPIPQELRPRLGNWIFGCDICQMVCPWNRLRAGIDGEYITNEQVVQNGLMTLADEMDITEEAFRHKFSRSPILRAKRKGYLRNIAVAIGNSGNVKAVPTLIKVLTSESDPLIRSHCAWALGQIGGEASYAALRQLLSTEEDMMVRDDIRAILGK